MALQTNTTVFINGQEITAFKHIHLNQQIDAHHTLEIVCRMDVLEDLSMALGETSKNFLGETITVQTASFNSLGYKELEFKGIVTQVRTTKGHETGSGDSIVILAQSPTFITDDGPHYASHSDVSLSDIVKKTLNDYDKSKLEVFVQPKNDPTLHYSVQHNQSAFNYISSLASRFGEWFYYDGAQLIFGKPSTEELKLTYGFDLKEYHLDLLPQSHNYKYFANDYLLDEMHEKDTKEITAGVNGYSGFVAEKSNTIFSKETKVWHNLYNDPTAKQRLDSSIKVQKEAIEIKQVQLNGISDNPGVKLGNIVNVEGANYRVIGITHTNNENGDYQNRFQAITAEFDAYPNTNIDAFPKSGTQTAVVMENADPEGLGRIRVQMPWQKIDGGMTPWIRIVTPHAGGDKGFHFIPEIKEEVLIGFEGGNAEHPYMMGSLYNGNGKAGAFQSNANDIKAIRTRSGHLLKFTEDESIILTDKSGNQIHLDTTGSHINITAPETMTFNCKNMKINVEENFDIAVGKDKTEHITNNYNLKTNNTTENIKQTKNIDVGKSYNQSSSDAKLIASKGDMTIHAAGVSTFQGNADVKISKG